MAKKSFSFERLQKQIQKDISDILLPMTKEKFAGKMISVSEVRLTSDKGIAKIYISVYPSQFGQEVVDHLITLKNQLRLELGNRIRHQVRHVPSLQFFEDITFDELEKINKLMDEVNKTRKEESNNDEQNEEEK